MKYYTLEAVVNGKTVKFTKAFATRDAAIAYMFNYYRKHYMYELMVNDEFAVNDDKHNIEYVIAQNNRFNVNRVEA